MSRDGRRRPPEGKDRRAGFEVMRRSSSVESPGRAGQPLGGRLTVVVVAVTLGLVAAACGGGEEVGSPSLVEPRPDDVSETAVGDESEIDVEAAPTGFEGLSLEAKIADFLADPSSTKGALVADAMGESGDPRWGPWLLDLYRLGRSTRIDRAATVAFADLSGVEPTGQRTDDYRRYGNWVYDGGVDPGDGYREWKLDVYATIDPAFADLLSGIPDDIVLSQIQWGGVTRGGIPELNEPERVPARAADWMTDEELVLGVVVEGVAVAYPLRILGHHELANDDIGGVPVSMVYCTLCRSGLLFDRRVGDMVLDFQTSGLLIESNKIMVDRQTDTLWRHQTGVGLAGPLEGEALAQYPVLTTSWGEWTDEHADTEVLAIPAPIFPDGGASPEQPAIAYSYDAGEAYRFYYEDPDVWFPVFDTPNVFELKEPVLGLSDGSVHLAIQLEGLIDAGPQVFAVGDTTAAVVPTSSGALVYDLTGADRQTGTLEGIVSADSEQLRLDDGSVFARMVVPQLFWFAWFGRHPATDWWPR